MIPITVLFGVIEVLGIYLLSWRIFRQLAATIVSSFVTAVLPLYVSMMSWAGYPNLIAVSLIPYVFIVLMDYWKHPTRLRLMTTVVVICGMLSIHHVSALWMGSTLVLFTAIYFVLAPIRTMRIMTPLFDSLMPSRF